jgi:hypothetical protein
VSSTKSECRISKYETNPKSETPNLKTRGTTEGEGIQLRIRNYELRMVEYIRDGGVEESRR